MFLLVAYVASLVQADTGQVVKGSLCDWTRHVATGH